MNKQTFEYWYENKFSLEQRIKEPHLKELLKDTWEEAYFIALEEGRSEGYSAGREEGYDEGFSEGRSEGYADGREDGYEEGYDKGRNIETWS